RMQGPALGTDARGKGGDRSVVSGGRSLSTKTRAASCCHWTPGSVDDPIMSSTSGGRYRSMRLHRRWMLAIAVATVCRTGIAQANGFRSSDVGSPDTPSVQAVAHMSDLMRQRSGGRLFIGS